MRIACCLLLLTCCIATSTATFKLLKSKLKPAPLPLIYPARHETVKYLASPVVIPEPLPATYARPVVKHSTHLSTYSIQPQTVVTYAVPVPVQTYAAPPAIYTQHDISPALYYTEPETVYTEPYSTHVVEEHWDKR